MICCSMSASVAGPSKVIRDALLVGLLLGALLHGLPELVLEALGDDGDVGLLAASTAAGCVGGRAAAARQRP